MTPDDMREAARLLRLNHTVDVDRAVQLAAMFEAEADYTDTRDRANALAAALRKAGAGNADTRWREVERLRATARAIRYRRLTPY